MNHWKIKFIGLSIEIVKVELRNLCQVFHAGGVPSSAKPAANKGVIISPS